MSRFAISLTFATVIVVLSGPTAHAQDLDPRVTQAVELFQSGQYVDAAKLFEEVEASQPANYLRLNAMAAWYKADRCVEARAANSRIVDDGTLEAPDRQDIEKISAYCTLKDAREHATAGRVDEALATIEGVQTQDVALQEEIASFRTEIEARKAAEAEAEVKEPPIEVEPPPATTPTQRPRWALWTGIGLTGAGAALGVATVVKAVSDSTNFGKGLERFATAYDCTASGGRNEYQCPAGRDYRSDAKYKEWNSNEVEVARTASRIMGVSAGVLAAGGLGFLTYYWLSPAPQTERALIVAPTFGSGGPGVALQLRF